VAIVALIFLGDNIAAILSSIGQQVGPPGGTAP
jgi:hypothetical protein